jgi:hypothetical protein
MITLSEIFYAVGVAGFSALGAACVTGIVTVLIWLANGSRERVIREEEREHSRNLLNDERANSRDSVADQRAYEDRVRVWEADRKEVEAKKATAKNEARILLELCRELLRKWDAEGRGYDTYSYDREWTRDFEHHCQLLPDAEFREFLTRQVRVINETWVVLKMEELEGNGSDAQHEQLSYLIAALAQYAGDCTWDHSNLKRVQSLQETIDDCWKDYHGDEA